MIRKDRIKFSDGAYKTQIRVVKSYRPGPKQTPRQVTIKSFGYLEDQEDQTSFLKTVERFDEEQKRRTKEKNIVITIPVKQKNNSIYNRKYNYGYRFLESIYEVLGIKEYLDNVEFKGEYSLNEIFEFLTLKRILRPESKRGTIQEIRQLYNKEYDFSLADVYRALDKYSDISVKLQRRISDKVKELIGRDSSYAFYDVTNYYFETDFGGEKGTYQQKGVSKEHRISPIIQLGLFMDSNNIPIAMSTFPGNTSDSKTLQPAMQDIKENYGLGRIIVVADKGLNTTGNIDYIVNQNDGYVVSQILRGPKGKRYHDIMFEETGYYGNEEFKYKLFEEEYESSINRNKKVIRRRKVLIYWSLEDSIYAKRKRQEKIERASKNLQNNVYSINHSAKEYVTTTNIIKATGEVSDEAIHHINYNRIEDEERFDGYFCIITSELDYNYQKILEVYSQLWRIEESFKITKSDLQTRPIYVRTQKHIEGHMLICYTALLILRLMQYKLGEKEISVDRIKKVLNSCTCVMPNDYAVLIDEVGGELGFKEIKGSEGQVIDSLIYDEDKDQIRQDYQKIQKAYGVDFDYSVSNREVFNEYIKSIKYKIKKNKKRP